MKKAWSVNLGIKYEVWILIQYWWTCVPLDKDFLSTVAPITPSLTRSAGVDISLYLPARAGERFQKKRRSEEKFLKLSCEMLHSVITQRRKNEWNERILKIVLGKAFAFGMWPWINFRFWEKYLPLPGTFL